MVQKISSLKNDLVRDVLILQEKSKERKKRNLFVIEGDREIRLAASAGFHFKSVFFCSSLLKNTDPLSLAAIHPDMGFFEVSIPVYNRMAYRKDAEGIIAVSDCRMTDFSMLRLSDNPLLLVLESVEKPGNLGALLRTADAASVDAVIICDPLTDVYNPNVIRSSVGCIFTVPVVISTGEESLKWMKTRGITSFATALTGKTRYDSCDFRSPSALIMGAEATGLGDFWLSHSDHVIKIPMGGKIDSMNVSVSAAIVIFEAKRQRNFG